MPDHKAIYAAEGQKYQELISKQPDLSAYINEIRPFSGLDIVDLGAGTGRLTTVLAAKANSIIAPSIRSDAANQCGPVKRGRSNQLAHSSG